MKLVTRTFVLCLALMIIAPACAKKSACGNSKKNYKQKTKVLKKNNHFNMM